MFSTALLFFLGFLTFAIAAIAPPGAANECLFAPLFC
jgi:hypothetical protein